MSAVLHVRFAGPQVSVQDAGRPGLMRYGVPGSGPMDRLSFAAANLALGNPRGTPAIEVSLGGVQVECVSGAVSFAVAGGGFILDHAGRRRGAWCVATLRAGERLTLRRGPWGSWCYLAFAGGLRAEHWLNSASTHATSGLGGGRIVTGQVLTLPDAALRLECEGDLTCPVQARPRHILRLTAGSQQRFFSAEALAQFAAGPWRTTAAGDRMGVRLSGPAIAPNAPLDMPSEPILRGAVQVAGDGVATVLLADHQTTGGYPKIGTALDCDLDGFAQLRPGDPLAFRPIGAADAVAAARTAARAAALFLQRIARE